VETTLKDGLGNESAVIGNERKMVLNRDPISHPFLENRDMEHIMNFCLRRKGQLVGDGTKLLDNPLRTIEFWGEFMITVPMNGILLVPLKP